MDSYPDLPRLERVEITRAFLVCHSQCYSKTYGSIHEKGLLRQHLMLPVHSYRDWLTPPLSTHANAAVGKAQMQRMILRKGSSEG